MSRAEAAGWRGQTAQYGDSIARFAGHTCRRPHYVVSYWPAAGRHDGARFAPLGIHGDSIMVIEIRCPGVPANGSGPRWQVPGALLIVKDRDHVLTVWDGVFFELRRQAGEPPDLRRELGPASGRRPV